MCYFRKNIFNIAMVALSASLMIGCGGSSSSKKSNEEFPASSLFLDVSVPFSVVEKSLPTVSGITFNYEEDYFLVSSREGGLLFLSPFGDVLEEVTTVSSFTGIEFMGDGVFLLSGENSIFTYNTTTQEVEELYSFLGRYDNIQSVAYREETEEVVFVNNGASPVLVYVSKDGVVDEFSLDKQFNNYNIDGLQLSDNKVFMGSPGFNQNVSSSAKAIVIQTELNGDFIQAWELDEKTLSGLAILDEAAPMFVTTNTNGDGSFDTYEPEALPSMASEEPLVAEGSIALGFDQPSGVDYLVSDDTFYYITDFGQVRSGKAEGNELLFEIEAQQGSYEAIAASINNGELELHIINSDDALALTKIEKYSAEGELLGQFDLYPIDPEHLFESLDVDPVTGRYYAVNNNEESRKYLYAIDDDSVNVLELPSDYDDYYISGLDYSESNDYLYFVTEEFGDQSGNNAGLMIIYDTANAIEIGRYSIVDTNEPLVGLETPSGVTINGDGSEIYITSDVDDSTAHRYSIKN